MFRGGGRNAYLDNAKFFLITSVVVGHVMEPFAPYSDFFGPIILFMHTYTVPLFAMISGYFSRPRQDLENVWKIMARIGLVYLVFQTLYVLFHGWVSRRPPEWQWLQPYWFLWYFSSLFLWRMLLPFVVQLRYPVVVTVLVGLLAGIDERVGYFLSLSRVIVFLPFFIAGYLAEPHHLALLQTPRARTIARLFLTAYIVYCAVVHARTDIRWLYGSFGYDALRVGAWKGIGERAWWYAMQTASSLSVLALIPTAVRWYTQHGYNSLYAHLFHGFFLKYMWLTGLVSNASLPWIKAAAVGFGFVLSVVLSADWFVRLTRWLVEPEWLSRLLLRPQPPPGAVEPRPRPPA